MQFSDNTLIDVSGSDLFVFEIGPDVKATAMAASTDADSWIRVESISCGKAVMNIAPYVSGDDSFR